MVRLGPQAEPATVGLPGWLMLSKLNSSPQAPFGEAPTAAESVFQGLLAPNTRARSTVTPPA